MFNTPVKSLEELRNLSNYSPTTTSSSDPLHVQFRVHQVHQELFKALPFPSSPSSQDPYLSSTNHLYQPQHNHHLNHHDDDDDDDDDDELLEYSNSNSHHQDDKYTSQPDHSSVLQFVFGNLVDDGTDDDDLLSRLFQDQDEGWNENTSLFELPIGLLDDLPTPTPPIDRSQPIGFDNLTYEDVVFIQDQLVSSSTTNRPEPSTQPNSDRAHNSTHTLHHQFPAPPSTTHHPTKLSSQPIQPKLSISPSFSSALNSHNSLTSQDLTPSILSPRSSALQQRLNQAKAAARIQSSYSRTTSPQPSNEVLSSTPTSLAQHHHPHSQLLSPSSSDSPDLLCFPLTPSIHNFVRVEPPLAHPDKHKYGTDSAIHQPDPNQPNPRGRRPVLTSILFQDVEAQAFAANAALRKTYTLDSEGQHKKPLPRKKTICTAHIGAPKLVSASASLPGLQLEAKQSQGRTQQSKGILKGAFKMKMNKKKISESGLQRENTERSVDDHRAYHLKPFPSVPNYRPNPGRAHMTNPTSLYVVTEPASTHTIRRGSLDHPDSALASTHHPPVFTSFRKLVNTVSSFKLSHPTTTTTTGGHPGPPPLPTHPPGTADLPPSSSSPSLSPTHHLPHPHASDLVGPSDHPDPFRTSTALLPRPPNRLLPPPSSSPTTTTTTTSDPKLALPASDEYHRISDCTSILDLYHRHHSHLPPPTQINLS